MLLPAADLTENARKVLAKRYLIKNEKGEPLETPEQMFERVARTIAGAEKTPEAQQKFTELFYNFMSQCEFMPNSPCLANAGRGNKGSYSACFVLPIEDSLTNGPNSIGQTMINAMAIHKFGGGTGFNFGHLRPSGDFVSATTGIASGPVSFMRAYDHVTEVVKQGSMRRGANMGMLPVWHPDIEEFITCKDDVNVIKNFNISVVVDNKFMEAVKADSDYELLNPRDRSVMKRVRARDIFNKIVFQAWKNGEPGVMFYDEVNDKNPFLNVIGPIEATNPCGEVPLLPYDSCNLGSLNLTKFVIDGQWDWNRLKFAIKLGVRFLDNVIEVNNFPLPQIEQQTKATRKIGLGVMGWADALIDLGIPYDSDEATAMAEKVMAFIASTANETSEKLADERGPYPLWEKVSKEGKFHPKKRRNGTCTVLAPTGTISIFAGCSGGIEPLYAIAFMRNQAGMQMADVNEKFKVALKKALPNASEEYVDSIVRKVAENGGSCAGIKEIPAHIAKAWRVAADVAPEAHVKMQAAFQLHTEDAISKTINFPNSATEEEVRTAYLLAYETKCKGITVYRDGCRPEQVLSTTKTAEAPKAEPKMVVEDQSPIREIPEDGRDARVYSVKTAMGTAHVTITRDAAGEPFEVFTQIGKGGSEIYAMTEAIGRMVSLVLRLNSPVSPSERLEMVREQLRGIGGSDHSGFGENRVLSVPDAIAKGLEKALRAQKEPELPLPPLVSVIHPVVEVHANGHANGHTNGNGYKANGGARLARDICPKCGNATLMHVEGCKKCMACGESRC